jgi:hypothetical protein
MSKTRYNRAKEFTNLFLEILVFHHFVGALKNLASPSFGFLADWPFFLLLFFFFTFWNVDFEFSIVDPDLDMIRLLQ